MPIAGAPFLAEPAAPAGNLGRRSGVTGPDHAGVDAMQRFLPHYLVFLAAHALFIGGAIAVAALN